MSERSSFANREALVVIDVQNDFCPGGSLPVYDGDKVVEPLNKMIYLAARRNWPVVFSRDWHPEKTTHFDKWPIHCVAGTEGVKFHPGLKTDGRFSTRSRIFQPENIQVFSKGMGETEDAYSAFDAKNTAGLNLEDFFEKLGVEELYVGGLATDYCVKASVIDAVGKLFKTYLLIDAIAAVNVKPEDSDNAIKEMVNAGVRITTVDQVLKKYLGYK